MTPAELVLLLRIYRQREENRRKEREADLYALACMTGQAVWGKLERYEVLFDRDRKHGREMTAEEMLDQVRALNAALGGTNSFDG
nr:MAG TPA: hypothetical protein [Caudoviricetes sp.]